MLQPLLGAKRFWPLFVTQLLGALNDNLLKNAFVILVTYQIGLSTTLSPAVLVTLTAGLFILPFFLCSSLAGQIADKYEKSLLIRIIKIAEIAIILLAIYGFHTGSVPLLMLTISLMGLHSTFFGPIKYAILPQLLHADELVNGNGLVEAGTFLAILIGTILGGTLVTLPHGTMFLSLLLLAVAIGGALSSWLILTASPPVPTLVLKYNILRETLAQIGQARKNRSQFLSILGISWFWLIGATFLSQFPALTKSIIGGDEHVVTFFLTLFSVGIAIGSLWCNRLLDGKVSAYYVPFASLGITLWSLDFFFTLQGIPPLTAQTTPLSILDFLKHGYGWHLSLDLLGIAISGGVYIVPLYTYLQCESDAAYRSRMIAVNNIMNALFMVIAALFTAVLLMIGCPISAIFLFTALLSAVVTLYMCGLLPDTLIKSSLRKLFTFFFRVEVHGLEHYEAAGDRTVIIANHTSLLDAALLAIFLPDKCTFAINTHIAKRWWVRPFLRLIRAFPIDPTNPMAMKGLIEHVREGARTVIFPEGRITVTGSLMKVYEGPGMIADKANAMILPIRIEGAQFTIFSYFYRRAHVTHWFPKITLTILPPEKFTVTSALHGRNRRRVIGNQLYDLMCHMIFKSFPYRTTLFEGLLQAVHTYGRRHLIVEDIERKPLSYGKLLARVFILAFFLKRTTKRDHYVGILLPNMVGTVVIFWALQVIGRVPAMLNFSAGAASILLACETASLRVVYTSRRFVENAKLTEVIEALRTKVEIVYAEDLRSKIPLYLKLLGMIASYFPKSTYASQLPSPSAESPAVLLFTSGSEGAPKGVVLSHSNIQANRYQIAARVDFNFQDRVFNTLPLFHSFGLTAGTLLPLLSGIKTFFYPSPLHYRIIPEIIYDINATILFGTDTFLAGYARYANPYDFYSVRYVFAGAEKVKDATRSLWSENYGIRLLEGYGATEMSPVICVNTPMHHRTGTVGRFLPDIEYRLEPVEGVENGGRLYVRGPNVMKGYLLHSKPGVLFTPDTPLGPDWYDTGDIVSVDQDGFVTIKGRAKRFAKIGGEMVSLVAVEEALEQSVSDYHHAVISVADEEKGEQLVLFTTASTLTRDMLTDIIRAHGLSTLAIPKKVIIQKALPLLGTGKVDYQTLKSLVS